MAVYARLGLTLFTEANVSSKLKSRRNQKSQLATANSVPNMEKKNPDCNDNKFHNRNQRKKRPKVFKENKPEMGNTFELIKQDSWEKTKMKNTKTESLISNRVKVQIEKEPIQKLKKKMELDRKLNSKC